MAIEYLNNRIFEDLISNYKKAKEKKKRYPEKFHRAENFLVEAFHILSDNIARAFKFQLTDVDDMLQEGIMICFDKLDRFNPNFVSATGHKSKAFNYFTTCVLNHYRQLYRNAKHQKQITERYFEFLSRKNQDRIMGLMSEICISEED